MSSETAADFFAPATFGPTTRTTAARAKPKTRRFIDSPLSFIPGIEVKRLPRVAGKRNRAHL
jgi:hypothetical protein